MLIHMGQKRNLRAPVQLIGQNPLQPLMPFGQITHQNADAKAFADQLRQNQNIRAGNRDLIRRDVLGEPSDELDAVQPLGHADEIVIGQLVDAFGRAAPRQIVLAGK